MGMPSLPIEGGCQCGAVRYRISMAPLMLYACHCRQCQKQSASAFGLSLIVPAEGVEIIAGKPKQWSRLAESGRFSIATLCGDCGGRIMHRSGEEAPLVALKPGGLDDAGWLEPVGHIWTSSAQPWTAALRTGLCIPGQPSAEDMAAMRRAFAERLG